MQLLEVYLLQLYHPPELGESPFFGLLRFWVFLIFFDFVFGQAFSVLSLLPIGCILASTFFVLVGSVGFLSFPVLFPLGFLLRRDFVAKGLRVEFFLWIGFYSGLADRFVDEA